jgi:hypothetical protein
LKYVILLVFAACAKSCKGEMDWEPAFAGPLSGSYLVARLFKGREGVP